MNVSTRIIENERKALERNTKTYLGFVVEEQLTSVCTFVNSFNDDNQQFGRNATSVPL